MERPVISFLTDFGPDGPAPTCRGVMLSIAPDAQIVDIAHGVRKYAVRDGAFHLWCAVPYLPIGIHVGVVDPGVGTERLPIAIRAGRGDIFVGPDNGLLVPAARRLGGIDAVRVLENRGYMLPTTSSTFHGRDIFAPVAAHLAIGRPFEDVGQELAPDRIVNLQFPEPVVRDGVLETAVLFIDSFGNVRLAAEPGDLSAAVGPLTPDRPLVVEFGKIGEEAEPQRTAWQPTFGRVAPGVSLVYEDSIGLVSFADNQGDAAGRLGLEPDAPVRIRAA